jgi:hypothetical protein
VVVCSGLEAEEGRLTFDVAIRLHKSVTGINADKMPIRLACIHNHYSLLASPRGIDDAP